jgi:hypothetical protein
MRNLWILPLMLACQTAPSDVDATVDTDATDTDSPVDDTDAATDSDGDGDVDADVATLTGTLRDVAGDLLTENVRVQYCRNTACRAGEVVDSTFTIADLSSGPGSFEVVALDDNSTLATVFAPLNLEASETKSIDVTMPQLDQRIALPATAEEIEVSDGLWVTTSLSDLEAPNPFAPDATHIGATNATGIGLPIEGLDAGTVSALYYMVPFDYHSTAGLHIRIRNDWGYADGEAALYAAVYESFSWELIDDLKDDGSGNLVTADGTTVPVVTTIAVVLKN